MPVTKSAKKALRSSIKKRELNTQRKFMVKQTQKNLRRELAVTPENYQEFLSKAFSALDKAAKRNVIHKNKANRKKARLAALVKKTLENKEQTKGQVVE